MIGINIKYYRTKKRISLRQLSAQSGVALGYLSEIESDKKSNPSIYALIKICKVLNIPLNFIIDEQSDVIVDDEWIKIVKLAINRGITIKDVSDFIRELSVVRSL